MTWEYSTESRAIVTGSARGIGRATAELLAEQGAKVLINDLDGDVAEEAVREIEGETVAFAGDLTKDGVPDKLVETAVEAFGQLDIIVNNAGYTWDGPIHKMTDEQFQAMLDIHNVVPVPRPARAPPRTCASRPRRSARRAARSSARSSTSRRSPARWATPARSTTPPASRASSA